MHRSYFLLLVLTLLVSSTSLCWPDSAADQQLRGAAAKGDVGAIRILLSNGADIDSPDENGSTPLIIATGNREIAVVKLLLEKGANVSARDKYDETALVEAARSMSPDLVRLLLDADPELKDKNAALFEAAESGPVVLQMDDAPEQTATRQANQKAPELPWVTVVRLLLDAGANIEARDPEGETPLSRAASYGQTEVFQLLLDKGARINVRDKRGMTPLIAAACACAIATMNSTYDILKILLQKGASVNAQDHEGRTALMMAASSPDDVASLRLLLKYGANPMLKDNKGETALNYAKGGSFPEKVAVLRKLMSKQNSH